VNRAGAVHREVSDHATLHQVDQERSDTGLDDMSAEHDDDRAIVACGKYDGRDYRAKVCGDENVWKAGEKGSERPIVTRRTREFFGSYFVGP